MRKIRIDNGVVMGHFSLASIPDWLTPVLIAPEAARFDPEMNDKLKKRIARGKPPELPAKMFSKAGTSSADADATIEEARRTLVEWLRSVNESRAEDARPK
jgi:hypothetical protein